MKFAKIYHEVLNNENIDANDLLVFNALMYFMSEKTGTCFPSISSLCKVSRRSENVVRKSIKHLAKLGIIKYHQMKDSATDSYKSNHYYLCDLSALSYEGLYHKKKAVPVEEEQPREEQTTSHNPTIEYSQNLGDLSPKDLEQVVNWFYTGGEGVEELTDEQVDFITALPVTKAVALEWEKADIPTLSAALVRVFGRKFNTIEVQTVVNDILRTHYKAFTGEFSGAVLSFVDTIETLADDGKVHTITNPIGFLRSLVKQSLLSA